ncbi:MAG: ABC transporter ATP-binding protein [Planctomycetota bacterium]
MSDADAHGALARTTPFRPVLSAVGIRKSFAMGDRRIEILHGIDFELGAGELVALVGSSGAGKSTLLHILGLIDQPTEGKVLVAGMDAWAESEAERAELRNHHMGFVFQFYHLLPELTALENVLLPVMISHSRWQYRRRAAEWRDKALSLLERFGMVDRRDHRPSQLSGGERQRVAMARALVQDPKILLADEPTGNLDSATGDRVLDLLFQEQARRGLSMILVTHDATLAARCQRTVYMGDGLVQGDSTTPVPV